MPFSLYIKQDIVSGHLITLLHNIHYLLDVLYHHYLFMDNNIMLHILYMCYLNSYNIMDHNAMYNLLPYSMYNYSSMLHLRYMSYMLNYLVFILLYMVRSSYHLHIYILNLYFPSDYFNYNSTYNNYVIMYMSFNLLYTLFNAEPLRLFMLYIMLVLYLMLMLHNSYL